MKNRVSMTNETTKAQGSLKVIPFHSLDSEYQDFSARAKIQECRTNQLMRNSEKDLPI